MNAIETISGVTGWEAECLPDIFHQEIFAIYQEKGGNKEERENGGGRKVWKWKWAENFFFFFFYLSLFETTEICLGLPKWTIFTWKIHISPREKIGKTDFATSEKYSSHASADNT